MPCYISNILYTTVKVRLLEDDKGVIHLHGAGVKAVTSGEELAGLIEAATKARTAAGTAVHNASSRSHFVVKISIDNTGTITLIVSNFLL